MSFDVSRKVLYDLTNIELQEFCSDRPAIIPKLKKLLSYYEDIFTSGNIAVNGYIKQGMEIEKLNQVIEDQKKRIKALEDERDFNQLP